MINFHHAPVQGHTDAPYRHYLNKHYPDVDARHYTPFMRAEHGAPRERDIRDLMSPLNDNCRLTPQVIFRNTEELSVLLKALKNQGASEIDLNVGCPFPLQTAKGRGAAMVANNETLRKVSELMEQYPEIDFSMKMRLGFANNDDWRKSIDVINQMRLTHITMHPRIAKQQYTGTPDLEIFADFIKECEHPVVYNGDIRQPSDINRILERFPEIAGVMCGRGELGRPSLFTEYISGREWSREERLEEMLKFHRDLFNYYSDTLCGDHQVLSKIKTFWDYAEDEIGHKAFKAISKSNSLPKYRTAIAQIE